MRDKLIQLLNKCWDITEQGLYHATFSYAAHVNTYSIFIEFSDTNYEDIGRKMHYNKICLDESDFETTMEELDDFLD